MISQGFTGIPPVFTPLDPFGSCEMIAGAAAQAVDSEVFGSCRERRTCLFAAMTSRLRDHRLATFYCAFGCALGGAVLDGAALGFALALACFFFFGAVSALGVVGGALVSCWASASDAVSTVAAGTASPVASPASKSTFRREIRSSRIGRNPPSRPAKPLEAVR
jgi:hypothetical protein